MDPFQMLADQIKEAVIKIEGRLEDIQVQIAKVRQKQQEIENEQKNIQMKQTEMQEIIDKKDNRVRAILKRIEGDKK